MTSALALFAGPALADLTAEQVLADQLQQMSMYGLDVAVTGQSRSGDTITVDGLTASAEMPEGAFTMTIGGAQFTEQGDGTVLMTYPNTIPLSIGGTSPEGEEFKMRDFRMSTFTWVAAASCHKPLYFEQVGVERYGHSSGPIIQPVVSGVHFFGDIVMLPYNMGLQMPNECVYDLGYYRPGDCAPWLVPGFPLAPRGFKLQGMAMGAAIALLP